MNNRKKMYQATLMDLKRNIFFKAALIVSVIIYLAMIGIGGGTDKNVWMAYAVYSMIIALAMPLIYHIRFSDKNQRIIQMVVRTKLASDRLYRASFDLFVLAAFGMIYVCICLAVGFICSDQRMLTWMVFSVWLELVICILLCNICFIVLRKYVLGLIAYLIIVLGLMLSQNVFIGVLFPMAYTIYGMKYVFGKLAEAVLLAVLKIGLERSK